LRDFEIPIQDFAYKFAIKEHQEIKDAALNAIEQMGKFSYYCEDQRISHTDWHLNVSHVRAYADIVMPVLISYFPLEGLEIKQFWFQQYEAGDYHGIHSHDDCNFSSVYYLELPDNSIKTKYHGQAEIDINEGDFLIMPAHIKHLSPYVNSGRKTSIVLNLNLKS